MRRTLAAAIAFTAGLLWVAAPAATQEHPHSHSGDAHAHSGDAHEEELEVGDKEEITLRAVTIIGDTTLEPGRYRIQHRVEAADHFVRFTRLDKRSGEPAPEIACRLEPLGKEAARTTIFSRKDGDRVRVTRILIRSENAAHVFP